MRHTNLVHTNFIVYFFFVNEPTSYDNQHFTTHLLSMKGEKLHEIKPIWYLSLNRKNLQILMITPQRTRDVTLSSQTRQTTGAEAETHGRMSQEST